MHTHSTTSLNLYKFDKHRALHTSYTLETWQKDF